MMAECLLKYIQTQTYTYIDVVAVVVIVRVRENEPGMKWNDGTSSRQYTMYYVNQMLFDMVRNDSNNHDNDNTQHQIYIYIT